MMVQELVENERVRGLPPVKRTSTPSGLGVLPWITKPVFQKLLRQPIGTLW